MTPDVLIDSFGARWQDAPPPRYRAAVLGINLTDALLNPPDDPVFADVVAHKTGRDAGVRDYVLNTQARPALSPTPSTTSPRCV